MGRKRLLALMVSVVLLAGAFPAAAGEEEGFSGEIALAALSRYIDRGQELSRHSLVLQPSFTMNYKGFSANVWGSWDSDPYTEGQGRWYETDYTLSYGGEFGRLNYEVGYSYYDMDSDDDSQDVYLTLVLNIPLNPTLTVYREIGYDLYWYFVLSFKHTFQLSDKLSLELCASAAYLSGNNAKEYPEVNGEGNETGHEFDNFHDGTLTVSLPYTASESITIMPTLSYTFPLCTEAKREMDYFSMTGEDHDFLYGGVSFAYSF